MPRCPFCDHRNPNNAASCAECGAELVAPADQKPPSHVEETWEEGPGGDGMADDLPAELDPFETELASLLKEGRKIEAIKRYRQKTGASLKSAKMSVENFARIHGLSGQSGCGTSSALLLAVGLVFWFVL